MPLLVPSSFVAQNSPCQLIPTYSTVFLVPLALAVFRQHLNTDVNPVPLHESIPCCVALAWSVPERVKSCRGKWVQPCPAAGHWDFQGVFLQSCGGFSRAGSHLGVFCGNSKTTHPSVILQVLALKPGALR